MATLLITLNSRKRKDTTQAVVIRIRHLNRYFDIPTGIYLSKDKFDANKGVLGDIELQLQLEEIKAKYSKRLRQFQFDNIGRTYSLEDIKFSILQKQPNELTVREFWEDNIDLLLKSNRGGSAKTYKNTLSVFSKIINLDCNFRSIGIKQLQTVEKELRLRGNNYNSIGVYMRTFRAVCNRAINYNLADLEWYPFRRYKIKSEKTVPRVISLEEMRNYFDADIQQNSPLYKAWNVGKLIFMLRGINLRDLVFLTEKNIKGDRIIYKRGKTGKMYSIGLHPEMTRILDLFKNDRSTLLGMVLDEYIGNESKSIHYRAQITKRLNYKLTKIGEMIGTNEKLTTYVFRYSYANIAKKLGYSKDLIAEALGHEYGNSVTGIYLELFDQEVLDKMNDEIIREVLCV
ncbi:tyrosine-type recombinase/integrase [Algoriphagus pacificus]|uniref:Phage integrase SAM-like domain-containing protein n=1 Tax=Algoriphagus pacificus TaxID=2811234 RepID=A0ABS3CI81_9BACT|nr:phage integrase SAM-like domain-containing protein [Algoriphagus pacificus]MBN7816803.1 phage integrase SAM-like domain-containing protein [Algoriphagus pacificus]